MKCKEIQELIMTDYIDGEMSDELYKEVKKHVDGCVQCKQFEQTVRQTAVEPFKKAPIVTPPESVWINIKDTIQHEQEKGRFANIRERLIGSFRIKKPVFAVAVITAAIFVAVLLTRKTSNNRDMVNSYLEEQIGFIAELDSEGERFLDEDDIDFGTVIEEFLM